MGTCDLADTAGRLYALAPGEFTEARNQAVAAARAAGDRELSDALKALRRPSTSAWLLNRLSIEHAEELDELVALGGELRSAQTSLATDEMRRLAPQRHHLVGALALTAERAADGRPSDAVHREIVATLDAVVVDEDAAAAVQSGRLVRALAANGFEPVDLAGAVAGPLGTARYRPRLHSVPAGASSGPTTSKPADTADPAAARRRRELDHALDRARGAAALAERALVRGQAAVDSADAHVDAAADRVTEAETALATARDALAHAEDTRSTARRDRDRLRRERDRAKAAVTTAEQAVASVAE